MTNERLIELLDAIRKEKRKLRDILLGHNEELMAEQAWGELYMANMIYTILTNEEFARDIEDIYLPKEAE